MFFYVDIMVLASNNINTDHYNVFIALISFFWILRVERLFIEKYKFYALFLYG